MRRRRRDHERRVQEVEIRMVQKEGLVMSAMPVVDCVSRAMMAAEKTL